MKNVILLCAAIMIAASSSVYATPILEFNETGDEDVVLYDILPLELTQYDDATRISEDINLNIDVLNDDNRLSEFALASTWTPSWDDSYIWDWWFDWFSWYDWTIIFPPCPIKINPGGDNPSPVPEPATMLLFGAGLIGLAVFTRKESKK